MKIISDKIKLFLIFLVFFALFLTVHLMINGFSSFDDPYYHAKHSALMAETGDFTLVRPWLKFHFLNYAPTDPWWGFHVMQALFIKFFGLVAGIKILASLLAALALTVFYFILKKRPVRFPLLWTALYFSASAFFLGRLLLERPLLLSFMALPLAFYYASRKKYVYLFLLSLVYALFYNLAPLVILLVIFYAVAEYLTAKLLDLKIIIAAAGGILAGFLLHPYSLNYIFVAGVHFFQVVFLKFRGINLSVGDEIQTPGFLDFIRANFLAVIFYLLAVVIFLGGKKNKGGNTVNYFLFAYSFFWFFITLLLPRGAEYWLPLGWLFIAFVFNDFYLSPEYSQLKNFLAERVNLKVLGFFVMSIIFVIILYNFSLAGLAIYERNRKQAPAALAQANDWLKKNTPAGAVVFYNNWGLWPLMFYYNTHNQYILGMDPTFLYEYDQELFWLWKNISYYGLYCARQSACLEIAPRDNAKLIKTAIKEKFQADYILLINNEEQPLAKFLLSDKRDFLRVFENERVLIYKAR